MTGRPPLNATPARLRRAVQGDEPLLRRVRLEALRDAPAAFHSTVERELARTPAEWQRWLAPGATYLLEPVQGDGADGLAAGVLHDADPRSAFLVAMWVRPERRGSGAADALVEAVAAWGRASGFTTLWLHVGASNVAARRLYARRGFVETGGSFVRDRDGMVELEMRRSLEH